MVIILVKYVIIAFSNVRHVDQTLIVQFVEEKEDLTIIAYVH